MDTNLKDKIKRVVASVIMQQTIDIEDACETIEEYIFEKTNERIVLNRYFRTLNDNSAFQYGLTIAVSYFQIKFNCMKAQDKNGIFKAVIFND